MLKATLSRRELTGTEYYAIVGDLIQSPELKRLNNFTHHRSVSRFQHCVNVSYYSYIACRRLGWDYRSAARGGLLHDLFYYDRREYSSGRKRGELRHSEMHAKQALDNAMKLTALSPIECDMIINHMWPVTHRLPHCRETYLLTLVDKYCAVLEFTAHRAKLIRQRLTARRR